MKSSKKQVMKSPFTGGNAELKKEPRVLEYRKGSFKILYHYYQCVDSAEQFTTTEIDTLNINQVHNKYRDERGVRPGSKSVPKL